MNRAAFLDTGVLLGYCFTVDSHHTPCKKYINESEYDYFTSPTVETEYENVKYKLNTRYSEAVLDHVSDLRRSDLEGQLGPTDLDHTKKHILNRGNQAYNALYRYYDEILPQFVQLEQVITQLRQLSRDIEQTALDRKNEIDALTRLWKVDEEYSGIRSALSDMHEPDLTICIEGHDLAVHMDTETELATCNPNDYTRNGREELILEHTALKEINCLI